MIRTLHIDTTQHANDDFEITIHADGNTNEHKDTLKQHGFRFAKLPQGGTWTLNKRGDRITIRDLVKAVCNDIPAERVTR